MNKLKNTRLSHGLTQTEAAKILGVSLRTYQRYELSNLQEAKETMFINAINSVFVVDEEHGVLTIDSIKELLIPVLKQFNISVCYLFGSYAKGKAGPMSDVDLLMDANQFHGLDFFGFVETLRTTLNKKVDLITTKQLLTSQELMETILKEGIRIYAERK